MVPNGPNDAVENLTEGELSEAAWFISIFEMQYATIRQTMMTPTRLFVQSGAIVLAALLVAQPAAAQDTYQRPAESLARLVDAPAMPVVSLSPDGRTLLFMHLPSLSSVAELSAPELRLAGIRINPRNNGPSRSRSYNALGLGSVDGEAERKITGLPVGSRIRNVNWAPDGAHVAFTVDMADRIDLYVVSATTAEARRLPLRPLTDIGGSYRWVSDSRTIIATTVPESRGAMPEAPAAAVGPVIQENMGVKAPARTYQDLLQNAYDEELFSWLVTSQLVRVTIDGEVTPIGEPDLITEASPSPDGSFLLIERLHKPFSYLIPYYRFPHRIEIVDMNGNLVREVADLPLAEGVPTAFGSVPTGVRSAHWRSDSPSTLVWVEALDGGDARVESEYRDEVFLLQSPFDADPVSLVRLPLRFGGITWGTADVALVRDLWWADRRTHTWITNPSKPGDAPRLLFDLSTEDRYNDPGFPVTRRTVAGTRVLRTTADGRSIYLRGTGASPEGNRPFLRRLDLSSGDVTEIFRSEAPYYERPIELLGTGEEILLTVRETTTEPPNYVLRNLKDGSISIVTEFPHPYPELDAIGKEVIQYPRADGVPLSATLYVPAGFAAERDGPLPTLIWAYPREFKSADAAGQRRDSPYQFKRVSYWGAVPYVTQGYAVIDGAAMPVIGEGDAEPNDTFREQLVANAQAAIDEGVRRGVVDPERVAIGGHSYGAFMTANLLAHSDLFRAGIARSGAYNRTLTPFGFQSEERLFWEAPEIYYYMSPFMHADKVNEPILLIHGTADNNSGTFPLQSRRYYSALRGLGKTARLVMLPHESHGYRARESILHMLWETDRWLDIYVKNAPSRTRMDVAEPTGE